MLLLFDSTKQDMLSEVEDHAQIGSINHGYKSLSSSILDIVKGAIAKFSIENYEASEELLAQVMSCIQSYGIHDYLVKDGVGGVFSGLWVSESGVHYQPDILYVIGSAIPSSENINVTSVQVRERVVCVNTSLPNASRCFSNHLYGETKQDNYQRSLRAGSAASTSFDAGRFDYITYLNTATRIITIVEMQRKLTHKFLMVRPNVSDEGGIFFVWTRDFVDMINSPPLQAQEITHSMGMYWWPYLPMEENSRKKAEAFISTYIRR